MRPLRAQVSISELYAKAGREAEGSVRVVAADCAAGVHNHEIVGVARTRGTEPPISGGTRAVVLVLNFAVPGGIIGVLRLLARLVRVRSRNAPENLVLREEEKVIRRRRDVARRRTSAAGVVRVLGNGLEDGTERRRNIQRRKEYYETAQGYYNSMLDVLDLAYMTVNHEKIPPNVLKEWVKLITDELSQISKIKRSDKARA